MRAALVLTAIAGILLIAVLVIGPALEAAVAEVLESGFNR